MYIYMCVCVCVPCSCTCMQYAYIKHTYIYICTAMGGRHCGYTRHIQATRQHNNMIDLGFQGRELKDKNGKAKPTWDYV